MPADFWAFGLRLDRFFCNPTMLVYFLALKKRFSLAPLTYRDRVMIFFITFYPDSIPSGMHAVFNPVKLCMCKKLRGVIDTRAGQGTVYRFATTTTRQRIKASK